MTKEEVVNFLRTKKAIHIEGDILITRMYIMVVKVLPKADGWYGRFIVLDEDSSSEKEETGLDILLSENVDTLSSALVWNAPQVIMTREHVMYPLLRHLVTF